MIRKYSKLFLILFAILPLLPFASATWVNPVSANGEDWNNPKNAIAPDENYAQYKLPMLGETTYLDFNFKGIYSDEIRFGVGYKTDLYAHVELYYAEKWHYIGEADLKDSDQPHIKLKETVFLEKARVKIKNRSIVLRDARVYWFQASEVEAPTPTPTTTPAPTTTPSPTLTPTPNPTPTPQQCIDGTPYGQCSNNQPKYCQNGTLINNCTKCGCPNQTTCMPNQSCCTPKTCQELNWQCGIGPEPNCNTRINCGNCPTDYNCQNHQCTPNPEPTPTPTPTAPKRHHAPKWPRKCAAGWKCRTENQKSYQYRDCSWGKAVYCKNGCKNGECVEPSPTQQPAQPQKTPTPNRDCGALKNGECSQYKPFYCKNQSLVMNCTKCGCNKGEKCNPKTRECEKNESILDSNSRRERQIIFVQPVNGENISQAGGIRSITVEIKKQDGKNEEVEKMPATLIVDGSLQNIELHRLEKGLYTAALEREIPVGTHALHLALHDDWNSNKTIHTTISKAADLTWFFAGMILLIIAISGTIELKNHIKEKNTKKEKQRFEIAKRRIMLKNLKLEFYKRHITEKEYRKEALRIQAEIKELQKNKKNKSHIKTPGRKVK